MQLEAGVAAEAVDAALTEYENRAGHANVLASQRIPQAQL